MNIEEVRLRKSLCFIRENIFADGDIRPMKRDLQLKLVDFISLILETDLSVSEAVLKANSSEYI